MVGIFCVTRVCINLGGEPSGGTVTSGGCTNGHRLGGGTRHGTVTGGGSNVTALGLV